MDKLSGLSKVFLILAAIGAVNWGLVGFFDFNLVDAIFGGGARETTSAFSRVIYAIVGLCGLGLFFVMPRFGEHHRRAERKRAEIRT